MAFLNDGFRNRTYDPDRGLELELDRGQRDQPNIYRLSNKEGGHVYFWASFKPGAGATDDRQRLTWTVSKIGEVQGHFPQAKDRSAVRALIAEAMTAYGYVNDGTTCHTASVFFIEVRYKSFWERRAERARQTV